ncbi:MAG: HEPN domain-containing protein [Candidatus Aminicenantes bacterium]|nr:HEPN domain-containing protein [Candidatus Aminicenantes bacterium]
MIYKESKNNLLKEALIKKCPIDHKAIMNLMHRAYIDLETANRNLNEDEECTYNYAYNAMMRSGLALMFSEGFRPEIKDKHLTVVRFASLILGGKFNNLINNYDFMRRKRHQFVYEPNIPCSKKEAKDALKTAKKLVDIIYNFIKKKNPQLELDF